MNLLIYGHNFYFIIKNFFYFIIILMNVVIVSANQDIVDIQEITYVQQMNNVVMVVHVKCLFFLLYSENSSLSRVLL